WAAKVLGRLEVPQSTLHPVVSTLPNGLSLIVQPEDVSETVSVYGHIRNRPETQERKGAEGVALVLQRLLTHGSEHLDRLAYQQALDAIGAREHAGTDFAVQALAEHFDRAVELLADNELHPALPESALQVIRTQVAQGVAARNASPGFLTQRSLRAALFPPDDPSLRMSTPETVRALTPEAVRGYFTDVFRPDLTSIVVIGKVDPAVARAAIEKYFGGWKALGPEPVIDLPPAPANQPPTVAVPDASRVQDRVLLAENVAITRSDPDYYPLALGNAVLGGSFYATRLSIDLRKNSGLVYSVASGLQAGRTRSVYLIEYASDPQNVAKAAAMVAREIATMQKTPVGSDELTRVKACLVRQLPLSESGVEEIAHGLLARADLGLSLDEPSYAAGRYIALDAAAVQAAFAKWLRPDDLVRVSEGPTPP
ncbi:MAG: insulinase family protein, partial [Gammaproteobacteria bacterium]|nr:insulinase family protein [Gammaproteobacteria bacterium]